MLPFQSETVESALARFPLALVREYAPELIMENPEDRPGLKREHVFDFHDGIRMIASIDHQPEENYHVMHLSFSLNGEMCPPGFSLKDFKARVRELCALFGGGAQPSEILQTQRAVHFTFPVPQSLRKQ